MKHYKRVLSVAGSDPSGGAGIQADLKTVSACGCYGTTVITAIVDENTISVKNIHPIPISFVIGQIHSVLNDIGTDSVKIGMLYSSELIRAVRNSFLTYNTIRNIVLDPVMVATSGDFLLSNNSIDTLKNEFIPFVRVVTPNIQEAEILLDRTITNAEDFLLAVKDLSFGRKVSVLLKAGHLEEETLTDVFYNAETDEILYFSHPRIKTKNTHGTGCTLSSAIAAYLACGCILNDAIRKAETYIIQAIRVGSKYSIGKGHGPVHHFSHFWE
ncbi:MAG: bifunctional hydroxymethylpyrimidine kinase/phosphomethylpyrimidine kinase [Candidatus Azobacteroides pseudotrichonymphae]|jgi:hydroxymethylpyrimidine/phosphomethylpyrimidine kinase|uniref:hydroxymethylpyrimidine kinase n=1 Tax=Azobacteroides pseudotrichonymphae genomovar. CFP2 TaxID=511995 RepID=B6YRS2_AZOPC|nr:bifunctional hydroxymethylpyrimidine kinase/phosphomethylpyrimidine kinase [Candidatus Azobacteroides pseudotrichonymphae]BAG83894.1 phosphomethylpyrimidine kinase [Candidatus Azobacteroides pseudotrichonymphae genomovar. CFP2]GMO33107.1 MAG: bifunctional hydroxymethylpyrimidine kinase/phosphomethylpyrimidine kinase [Candidatus Azobacteroides pseudotrichonymphae]